MARLVPVVTPISLAKISIRDLADLTPEDVRELQDLDCGSLQVLIEAMIRHDGDLTELSTDAIVIDQAQSDRIGDAVLAHPATPAPVKARFVPTAAPATLVPATPAPVGAQSQPQHNWLWRLLH